MMTTIKTMKTITTITMIQPYRCLKHNSVYLVESVSARSFLKAICLDLNNYSTIYILIISHLSKVFSAIF